ncbi:MAG: protein kinase domain-containing protein [Phycisphaerales bacterium]
MLEAGTQLGAFKVEKEIGRGGMGVVYLATDTRLGRSVAIKALPPGFSQDADRLARFEREARTLAALHHPNVAMIHGVEEKDGARFLVLEYVEGKTLGERLDEGPLPVDEALSVCAQIAAGLEVAHDAGVVHRDLKPANVRLTSEGAAKVLDFGLAKGGEGSPSSSSAAISTAPTVVTPRRDVATAIGVVMGTAGYMSPEQARGRSVDRRADIWALGCVLYECLTGQSPFRGETPNDTVAAVLEREPDWSKLPARTPTRVRELLKRCLEKDFKKRLRDIGDARMELEQAIAQREWTTTSMSAAEYPRTLPWFAIGAAAAMIAAAIGGWMLRGIRAPSTTPDATKLSVVFPNEPRVLGVGVLSADGRMLVVRGETKAGPNARATASLYVRRMNDFQLEMIKGTEGAQRMDISADGKSLLFTTTSPDRPDRSALKYMPLSGGPALTLYEEPDEIVARVAFSMPDTALFTAGKNGGVLKAIGLNGGKAREIFDFNSVASYGVGGVQGVEGGKWALVMSSMTDARGWHERTLIASLVDGTERVLLEDGAFAKSLPGGILVFSRADALMACRFDEIKGECIGGPVPVTSGLRALQGYSSESWTVCPDRLAFVPGGRIIGKRRIAAADMTGKIEAVSAMLGDFEADIAASPDGKQIAGLQNTPEGVYEMFVLDVAKDATRRLALRGSDCNKVVWTPDGINLVFAASNEADGSRLMIRRADGSDQPRLLVKEKEKGTYIIPWGVTPDGKMCLAARFNSSKGFSAHVAVPLDGGGEPQPLSESQFTQMTLPVLSPDGRWIASSPKGGSGDELAVGPNPLVADLAKQRPVTVLSHGAAFPRWSRDGKSLYFLQDMTRQMVADVTAEPELTVSVPRQLFEWDERQVQAFGATMTGDGKRLLFIEASEDERFLKQVNIAGGWADGLREKLGFGK